MITLTLHEMAKLIKDNYPAISFQIKKKAQRKYFGRFAQKKLVQNMITTPFSIHLNLYDDENHLSTAEIGHPPDLESFKALIQKMVAKLPLQNKLLYRPHVIQE